MSNKPRVNAPIPNELYDAILDLRKTDEYCRCSISEIVRHLLVRGLEAEKQQTTE